MAHKPLAMVLAMLDAVVANEGTPDVVQISGGEPTLHPDFFHHSRRRTRRPIRHLMLNTNGVRIAQDRELPRASPITAKDSRCTCNSTHSARPP